MSIEVQAPPRRAAAGARRPGRGRRFDWLPYALITPLVVFIIGLALFPAGVTLVEAFFRVQPLNPPDTFTGFANFVHMFQNDAIVSSMVNTAYYVVIGVVLSTVLGILMAVILQKPFRGRAVLIAVLILPWALPGV